LASDQDDPIAALRLASLYQTGRGVSIDYEKSTALLLLAAKQNIPAAAHYYADALWVGRGVPKDAAKGVKWYHKAADLGWPVSARMLAGLYFSGQIVPLDRVEASKWMQIAAAILARKDPLTRKYMNAIWPKLSEAERDAGRKKALAFLKSHAESFKKAEILR
jgi:TPR repeat protein